MNKLIHGDCVEVMRGMEDGSIDLVVTSPPYDDLRTYNGYSFDFENTAKELVRLIKHGGVIVWVVGDQVVKGSESGTSFRQTLYFMELGLNLHDTMIYEKIMPKLPDQKRYLQAFEFMFVFSKGETRTTNIIMDRKNKTHGSFNDSSTKRKRNGELVKRKAYETSELGTRTNIWRYGTGHGHTTLDKYAFGHPAMFPEKLAKDHIVSWSNPGDIVLDPFAGSGTTPKMTIETGRDYIAIESNKDYYEIAQKRIAGAQPALFT